ncbi:ribosome biogenesis regulatory protein homolog [Homarus americanus]|uniref:ribosome biogenesis regulatory protein homolog n=1 Tax=Homarus americanus TaxID=6706 RepID=UPI001C440A04|nr:ribosome biogenesis regulatory protein homolog [Homarus americanus]
MGDDTATEVQEIITKANEELKSIEVHKEIQLECDLGNLLVTDKNTVNENLLRDENECDAYLRGVARDSIQALLTKVWDLTTQQIDNALYVTLPKPTTRLPREKPAPKGRQITKWEQYARDKGIQRRKKDKKMWDDVLKRWVPRYGYRKIQAEKEKNWVKEVPDHGDPFEDQFAKVAEMKKENIAKNEFQRLRNIAKSQKVKVPNVGVTGNEYASTKDLGLAMHYARHATASMGKFQPNLPDEKKTKGLGKKRKQEQTTGDGQAEKKRYMEVLDKMEKPDLNLEGAIHKQISAENVEMDLMRKGGKKFRRRSKMGGRHRTKSDHRGVKLGKGMMNPKLKKKGGGGGGAAAAKAGGGGKGKAGGLGGGRGEVKHLDALHIIS